ncbi:MAG: PDZ domain-containing protein [Candidatus Melainabacteria bacterium]|jgi:carboxyl-terminal processing protease|nr:PDZ domain-containing protein [Candidatus Melainabacteria bacterium]
MRKFLTSLLVLCFAAMSTVSVTNAQTPEKKPVNPIIIIMGAGTGGDTTTADENTPVVPGAGDKAKPVNPLDSGGPLPEELKKFFQMFSQQAALTPQQLENIYKSTWAQVNATYYDHAALKDFGAWKNKYDGKLTTQAELEAAIKEMMASLGDKWTFYTTSEEIKQSTAQHNAGLEPLGMMFKKNADGTYSIDYVMYGTPAQKSILRKGDVVKSINGKDLAALTPQEVERLTLVKAGDEAQVVFVLDGQDQTLTLKSAPADAPDLNAKLLPGGIAFIRLPDFSGPQVIQAFVSTLAEMHKANGGKLNGIILDLRGNPGGVFDLARQFSSLFLAEGVIVTSTTRNGLEVKEERFSVVKAWPHDLGDADAEDLAFIRTLETAPMAVLVDGNSASSAEIVTGALKDNGRAVIVGETTWGKGVGYSSGRHRGAGGWISVTGLSYLTPSGYNLANKGIVPNIEVAQPRGSALDVQLDAAIKAVKDASVTPAKPQGQQSSPLQLIDPSSVYVQAAAIALFLLIIVCYGVHLHMRAQRENKKNGGK